jgi:hypothetical protein
MQKPRKTENQTPAQYTPFSNQDSPGIATALPKRNLDKKSKTEFVDVNSKDESEGMVFQTYAQH